MTATVALVSLLGVAITALTSYIIGSRRLSGRIATSEASSLWAESSSIREYLAQQLDADRRRITDLEARIASAEASNVALARENLDLIRKLTAAEATIGELRDELADLRRENQSLRSTIRKAFHDDDVPPGPDRLAD